MRMLGRTIPAVPPTPAHGLAAAARRPRARRLAVAVVVVVLAAGGWLAVRAILGDSDDAALAPGTLQGATKPSPVRSSKGGFSVVFPDGWNQVRRLRGTDTFYISGDRQPEAQPGRRAMVTDTDVAATEPYVLLMTVGESLPPAQGEASDVIFGRGEDLLSGTRFVQSAGPSETPTGGSAARDVLRTYTYVFALGGDEGTRELRVEYRIYRSDERDMISDVETMVRSVRLLR